MGSSMIFPCPVWRSVLWNKVPGSDLPISPFACPSPWCNLCWSSHCLINVLVHASDVAVVGSLLVLSDNCVHYSFAQWHAVSCGFLCTAFSACRFFRLGHAYSWWVRCFYEWFQQWCWLQTMFLRSFIFYRMLELKHCRWRSVENSIYSLRFVHYHCGLYWESHSAVHWVRGSCLVRLFAGVDSGLALPLWVMKLLRFQFHLCCNRGVVGVVGFSCSCHITMELWGIVPNRYLIIFWACSYILYTGLHKQDL